MRFRKDKSSKELFKIFISRLNMGSQQAAKLARYLDPCCCDVDMCTSLDQFNYVLRLDVASGNHSSVSGLYGIISNTPCNATTTSGAPNFTTSSLLVNGVEYINTSTTLNFRMDEVLAFYNSLGVPNANFRFVAADNGTVPEPFKNTTTEANVYWLIMDVVPGTTVVSDNTAVPGGTISLVGNDTEIWDQASC